MTAPPIITEIIGSPNIFPDEDVVVVVAGVVVVVVPVEVSVVVLLGIVGVVLVVVVITVEGVVTGWVVVAKDVSADQSDHTMLLS